MVSYKMAFYGIQWSLITKVFQSHYSTHTNTLLVEEMSKIFLSPQKADLSMRLHNAIFISIWEFCIVLLFISLLTFIW